ARVTARGGLAALIAGLVLVLVALANESSALFLVASAICGVGFGPAFAGVFRLLTTRAPADERASLTSSVFAVSYIAFSITAILAGVAVTQVGLRDTAEVYGAALIALAALALVLSGALAEPTQRATRAS